MRTPRILSLLALTAAFVACSSNQTANPGHATFIQKGCSSCHGVNGEGRVGPKLQDLYGTDVSVVDSATGNKMVVAADEDYLKRSITDPRAQVVPGFNTPMPTADLSDEQLDLIVGYLIDIGAAPPPTSPSTSQAGS